MPISIRHGDTPGLLLVNGGDQKLRGQPGFENFLFGDADTIGSGLTGGNDTIIGATGLDPTMPTVNNLYGDADLLMDGTGGNDLIAGRTFADNFLHGDARRMESTGTAVSQGGNDRIGGADNAQNVAYGDAFEMLSSSIGGNDTLTGGDVNGDAGASNTLHGDAGSMTGAVRGGDDLVRGGDFASNVLYGDAFTMTSTFEPIEGPIVVTPRDIGVGITPIGTIGLAQGGDDTVIGGPGAYNLMHGDASVVEGGNCGDDLLIAGRGATNIMYGDAFSLAGVAGNDTLVSAGDFDELWGDAVFLGTETTGGHDVFRFTRQAGESRIMDFRKGEDLIDLRPLDSLGIDGIEDLSIEENGGDSVIMLPTDRVIIVFGVTGLAAEDFLFA
jgi:hypothetical protein